MENNIAKIIKELRKNANLTQKELADKINVTDKAISHWEKGDNLPPIDMLNRISKFFNVPLNSLITARVEEDDNDALVEDVINEFNQVKKKTRKLIRIIITVSLVIFLFLTAVIIFTNTYNRFKVYNVSVESKDFYPIYGTYVETRIKDSLTLQDIHLKNYTIKEDDIISVDLYYLNGKKKTILESYSYLEHIQYCSKDSIKDIKDLSNYFDNIYLSVKIISSNNKVTEFIGKLKFELDFSNNKINKNNDEYNNNSYVIGNKIVKNKLIQNGFIELDNELLVRKSKGKEYIYYINSNRIMCKYDLNGFNYRLFYNFSKGILDVSIVNDSNVEVENYNYNASMDKVIRCKTGSCNNYKEIMDLINKDVLSLIKQ